MCCPHDGSLSNKKSDQQPHITPRIGKDNPDNQNDICGISKALQSRIVGGQNAVQGAYPWLALLGYKKNNNKTGLDYKCAGSLITKLHVITAAHCINAEM